MWSVVLHAAPRSGPAHAAELSRPAALAAAVRRRCDTLRYPPFAPETTAAAGQTTRVFAPGAGHALPPAKSFVPPPPLGWQDRPAPGSRKHRGSAPPPGAPAAAVR